MALPRWFYFIVVLSVTEVCWAQCVIRTLVPMTMMDPYPMSNAEDSSSTSTSADDISALLLLARALEMDRASSANNGIDVNSLLTTLINALVYTATQNSGRGNAPVYNNDNNNVNNNWQGFMPGQPTQPNQHSYPSQPNHHTPKPNHHTTKPNNHPNTSSRDHTPGKNDNDEGLIDLQLLGPGKDNVAKLDVAKKNILGVGLASDGEDGGSGLSGLLSGLIGDNGGAGGGLLG